VGQLGHAEAEETCGYVANGGTGAHAGIRDETSLGKKKSKEIGQEKTARKETHLK